MKRIHIVGAGPRTGTTLLAEAMRACFAIDAVERHEAPLSRHRRRRAGIYLTKMPIDIPIVEPRLRIDRHFHVIALVRDPRDAVVSRHARLPDVYYTPLRLWKSHVGYIRRLRAHPRFVLIRYEDLVRDPDAVQDFIAKRMPFLRKTGTFSRFHEVADPSKKSLTALGGLRAIDDSSIGTWREHLPRLAGQLAQHGPITDELIEFGYETDGRWLALLDSVAPDLTPSYHPEHIRRPVWRLRWRAYSEATLIAAARLFRVPLV
jgi:hypothetical protein